MTNLQLLDELIAKEITEITDEELDRAVEILRNERKEFLVSGPSGKRTKAPKGAADNIQLEDLGPLDLTL